MSIIVSSVMGSPYRTEIQAGRHTVYADTSPANGGQDTAPSPHELLLGALGACTSMTLQMFAQRKGWDLKNVEVQLSEARDPVAKSSVITKNIEVKGNLTLDQLKQLKTVAEKCPVNKLIIGPVIMNSSLSLVG